MAEGDQINQGEQGKEGEANNQQDANVSKADLDNLQTQMTDVSTQLKAKDKELEDLRLEMLSPDYISYVQSKEKNLQEKPPETKQDADLNSMTRDNLVKHIVDTVSNQITNKMNTLVQSVDDMRAGMEVKEVSGKYKDFWEFKGDIMSILKTNPQLSVENSYKLAKQNKKQMKDVEDQEKAAAAIAEKPGGTSSASTQPVSFKTESDAAEDAWTKTMGDKTEL